MSVSLKQRPNNNSNSSARKDLRQNGVRTEKKVRYLASGNFRGTGDQLGIDQMKDLVRHSIRESPARETCR